MTNHGLISHLIPPLNTPVIGINRLTWTEILVACEGEVIGNESGDAGDLCVHPSLCPCLWV